MAVGTGDNNDIKIPYRIPITAISHEAECSSQECQSCLSDGAHLSRMIRAVEASQSAQVGYHCDYCNKRQPIGVAEAKEWEHAIKLCRIRRTWNRYHILIAGMRCVFAQMLMLEGFCAPRTRPSSSTIASEHLIPLKQKCFS